MQYLFVFCIQTNINTKWNMLNNFTKSRCIQKISARTSDSTMFLHQYMYFSKWIRLKRCFILLNGPLFLILYDDLSLYTCITLVRFFGSLSFKEAIIYLGGILYFIMTFTSFISLSFKWNNIHVHLSPQLVYDCETCT